MVFNAAMCIIDNGIYAFAYSWSNILWSEPKSSYILRGRAKCGTGEVWQSFSMHNTEAVYGYFSCGIVNWLWPTIVTIVTLGMQSYEQLHFMPHECNIAYGKHTSTLVKNTYAFR